MSDSNNPICTRSEKEIRKAWKKVLFAENEHGKTFLRDEKKNTSALGIDIQNCIHGTALGRELKLEYKIWEGKSELWDLLTAEQERRKKALFLLSTDRWQSEKGEKKDTNALINILTTLTVVVGEQTDERKKNRFLETIIHYLVTTV